MIKKIISASIALAVLAALMPASLADTGDLKPYNGWIGADSPLYSIKIFFQNLDVTFTFNNTARMDKQMNYADERLSEALAMAIANNTAAFDAAIGEYDHELDAINNTTQAPDINGTDYANLMPMLVHHQQVFYALMNNSTAPVSIYDGIMCAYNQTVKVKNGMPFYDVNDTRYFIPPGWLSNNNTTNLSPGLAKKGYTTPQPSIINGSPVWPWDEINYSYNTTNGTVTIPTMRPMPDVKHNNGNKVSSNVSDSINGNLNVNGNKGGNKVNANVGGNANVNINAYGPIGQ